MTRSNSPGSLPGEGDEVRVRGQFFFPVSALMHKAPWHFNMIFSIIIRSAAANELLCQPPLRNCSGKCSSDPTQLMASPAGAAGEHTSDVATKTSSQIPQAPPPCTQHSEDSLSSRSTRAAVKRFCKLSSVSVFRSRSRFS